MPSKAATDNDKKTTQSSAQEAAGKEGLVGYAAPSAQLKKAEQPLSETLSAYSDSQVQDPPAFATIQRQPHGDYADEPPDADGTYWDTDTTTDHDGTDVPDEVIAVMRNPGDGGTPSVNPPGWAWLKTKFGKLKGDWVRFHIINAQLGGPGNDASNLVPTTQALNLNGGWRGLEDNAKASATDDDDATDSTWTYVEVDLDYDDEYPSGIPESIDATWGYDDGDNWVQSGGAVHLAQANPDDDTGNHFLPAAQITQARLREFGCTPAEAHTLKGLIDQQWDSQDDFDQAVDEAEGDEEASAGWHNAFARMYVDEDEDFDGPYDVVVNNELLEDAD